MVFSDFESVEGEKYLSEILFKQGDSSRKKSFTDYFKKLNLSTFILEDNYIDKDYLVDYSNYISLCYHPYERFCKRIHFFSIKVEEKDFLEAVVKNDIKVLETIKQSYLGFIVVRPLNGAKIGKTCLKTYPSEVNKLRYYPATRSYNVNLMGIEMTVNSLAFQEQDQTTAMCASIALWSALQKTGKLFQHRIPTPSEITTYALSQSSHITKFPNSGLTVEQICVCLNYVGLNNFLYKPKNDKEIKAIIYSYLSANIPVILALTLYDHHDNGVYSNPQHHAVTVGGFGFQGGSPDIYSSLDLQLHSSKITRLFNHDDQLCPFSKLKFIKGSVQKNEFQLLKTSWANNKNRGKKKIAKVDAIIVPLYHKIRLNYIDIYSYVYFYENAMIGIISKNEMISILIKIEWEIFLSLSNSLKEDILEAKNILDAEHKLEILSKSYPKYLWRAKASIYAGGRRVEVFEIVFDATDIKNGNSIVDFIIYDNSLFEFYVNSYLDYYKNLLVITELDKSFFVKINEIYGRYFSKNSSGD